MCVRMYAERWDSKLVESIYANDPCCNVEYINSLDRCPDNPAEWCHVGNAAWNFSIKESDVKVEVRLPASRDTDVANRLQAEIAALAPCERSLLVRLAIAIVNREPVLLQGPSTYKTHVSSLLARMIQFDCFPPAPIPALNSLNLLPLSKLTDRESLIGSIEPHGYDSYVTFVLRYTAPLFHAVGLPPPLTQDDGREKVDAAIKELIGKLKALPEGAQLRGSILALEKILVVVAAVKKEGQAFPFCERGILQNIRVGGLVLLEHMGQPDPAVWEGLNSLFDVKRSFQHTDCGEAEVPINSQFSVVGTADDKEVMRLSPATLSRFTCIRAAVTRQEDIKTTLSSYIKDLCKGQERDPGAVFASVQVRGPEMADRLKSLRPALWLASYTHFLNATMGANQAASAAKALLEGEEGDNEPTITTLTAARTASDCPELRNISKISFVETKSSTRILSQLLGADCCRLGARHAPVPLLVGPPGCGKTFVCQHASELLDRPLVHVPCSANTQVEDLFGSFAPRQNGDKVIFEFVLLKRTIYREKLEVGVC